MDSNELSQAIRKIIGYPEKTNQSQEARQGKRVLGGVGEYWYNGGGSSKNGDKKGDDKKGDDKKGDKKKGGKKGDDQKDPIGDPMRRPQVGETMPRLEGLHDCGTGQCVAVNFDPNMAKKPDGWQDPCTPPTAKKGDRVYKIQLRYWEYPEKTTKTVKTIYTRDPEKIRSIAERLVSEVEFPTNTKQKETDKAPNFPYTLSKIYFANGAYSRNMWYGGERRADAWVPLSYTPVIAEGGEPVDDNGGKPADCAEIVATAGGFKPACENTSSYPPALQGSTTGFTLCDAEGNPVDVETNGRGWKITTKDYTAIVDEEFTVQSVTDN